MNRPERVIQWPHAALIAFGVTALVGYVVSPLLASPTRLPGIDAINLYAWESYTRSVLRVGRLPFWNPFFFSGSPHLADAQTTVFYPVAIMLRWLPIPAYLSAMAAVHMVIAGLGGMLLVRVAGGGWTGAAAAAMALALGGSTAPWIHDGHLLLLYSAAWFPWVLAFALLTVERSTWWPHPGLVAACALQYLTGYLQGTLYTGGALLLITVVTAFHRHRNGEGGLAPVMQVATAAALAAALVAFQLIPASVLAHGAGRTLPLSYEVAAAGGWQWRDLLRFVNPRANLVQGQGYRELADSSVYVGWLLVLALPCAFVARERRRVAVVFAILGAAALAMATSESLPLFRIHYWLFPGLRVPGRILFVTTVSVAVLGALGLDTLMRVLARTFGWQAAQVAGVLVLAGLMVDLTAFAAPAVDGRPVPAAPARILAAGRETRGRVLSTCENRIGHVELLVAGRPSVDGVQGMHLRDYTDWAYVVRTGDRPVGDGSYRRIDSESRLPARLDLVDAANVTTVITCTKLEVEGLELTDEEDGLYVYRSRHAWPRAVWTCDRTGRSRNQVIDALLTAQYAPDRVLKQRSPINVRWAPGTSDAARRAAEHRYGLSAASLREAGTWRYMVEDTSPANIAALLRDASVEDTAGINSATLRVTGPIDAASAGAASAGTATDLLVGREGCPGASALVNILQRDGLDGRTILQVEAPVDGMVVVSEPRYVERYAYVDDQRVPIRTANLAWTAVPVPRGRHRIELRVVPVSFYAGSAISAAAMFGSAWFAGTRRRRRA